MAFSIVQGTTVYKDPRASAYRVLHVRCVRGRGSDEASGSQLSALRLRRRTVNIKHHSGQGLGGSGGVGSFAFRDPPRPP